MMRKRYQVRFLAFLSMLTLCVGMMGTALVTTAAPVTPSRASDYLDNYDAWATTGSSREVVISFDVNATNYMDLVGSTCIVIQEKSGSSWVWAYTYYGSVANGMLVEDSDDHSDSISYMGTSGTEYRALVTVYAEDGSGSDYRTVTTNSVVAP